MIKSKIIEFLKDNHIRNFKLGEEVFEIEDSTNPYNCINYLVSGWEYGYMHNGEFKLEFFSTDGMEVFFFLVADKLLYSKDEIEHKDKSPKEIYNEKFTLEQKEQFKIYDSNTIVYNQSYYYTWEDTNLDVYSLLNNLLFQKEQYTIIKEKLIEFNINEDLIDYYFDFAKMYKRKLQNNEKFQFGNVSDYMISFNEKDAILVYENDKISIELYFNLPSYFKLTKYRLDDIYPSFIDKVKDDLSYAFSQFSDQVYNAISARINRQEEKNYEVEYLKQNITKFEVEISEQGDIENIYRNDYVIDAYIDKQIVSFYLGVTNENEINVL